MDAASRRFVHIDEMINGIGKRLAELTGAEWGIVTSGCAAALAHATTACVAGGNPDLMCASRIWKGSTKMRSSFRRTLGTFMIPRSGLSEFG